MARAIQLNERPGSRKKILATLLLLGGVVLLGYAMSERSGTPARPAFDLDTYSVPGEAAPEPVWPSEVANDLVGAQLKALGKLLAGGEPLDEAALGAYAVATVKATPLRPTALSETRVDPFTVQRWDATESAGEPEQGLAHLGEVLGELRKPLAGLEDPHFYFKIVGVELMDDTTARMKVRVEGWAHGERGVQITTDWESLWKLSSAAPAGSGAAGEPATEDPRPLLTSLTLKSYEEAVLHGHHGALFRDCTEAVLAGDEELLADLQPGIHSWEQRVQNQLGLHYDGHHGIAVGDADGDGLEDVYVCQPGGLPNRLLRQNPDGTVTDTGAEAGVDWLDESSAALFLDLDDDGDQDLAIMAVSDILILENDGGGKFEIRTRLTAPEKPTSLSAADYDADGDLDLYACGYHSGVPLPYHDAQNGLPNFLFNNDGDWKFHDATEESGLSENNHGFSFAAVWEDYDDDGDVDLYVANDYGRNNLFANDGGKFVDVAEQVGVLDVAAGMGVTWGDVNHDGVMDLHVSNMFSSAGLRIVNQDRFAPRARESLADLEHHARGNSLFLGSPEHTFTDVSVEAGVTLGRWAWASMFADINQDGLLDLLVANGFVTGESSSDL